MSTKVSVSTSLDRIAAIAPPGSVVLVAKQTSTNASRIPAKMRVHALTSAVAIVAFACPVSLCEFFAIIFLLWSGTINVFSSLLSVFI